MADWTKMNVIPFGGLEYWHQYEAGVSANGVMNDYSGKGRHLANLVNPAPVLTSVAAANNQMAWYFNGSSNPLVNGTTMNCKHFFMVVGSSEASFSQYRGLLSSQTLVDILVADSGTTKFVNGSATSYRKSDVAYAASNQQAPMSGSYALVEILYSGGAGMDGVQIGSQRNLSSRLWYGYVFDSIGYSTEKNEYERYLINRYVAMRYWIWQKSAAGLNVFPFIANKARGSELELEHFLSEPYSGDPKALVRGTSKRMFTLPFSTRTQEEFLAAEQFHKTHYPLTHMIFRDYRFYPTRDIECRIISPLREQGSDVSGRFNYSFDLIEV